MNGNRTARMLLVFAAVLLIAALPLTALATAEEDANKELATRWVQEFLVGGDLQAAMDMVTPDFAAHDLTGSTLSIAAFKAELDMILEGDTASSSQINAVIAEGNQVAIRWTEKGLLDWESVSPWTLNGVAMMRIQDGKIAVLWYSISRQFDPEPEA